MIDFYDIILSIKLFLFIVAMKGKDDFVVLGKIDKNRESLMKDKVV